MPYDPLATLVLKKGLPANDPLAARRLQEQRQGELQDRVASDAFDQGLAPLNDQNPAYIPGSPGERYQGAASANANANMGRDKSLLESLTGEMGADPFTGDAAHKRVQDTEDQLNTATMFNNPQMTGMRKEQDATKLKLAHAAPGGLDATQAAGANQLAVERAKADATSRQQHDQNDFLAQLAGGGGAAGGGGYHVNIGANGKPSLSADKLSQQEQATVDTAQQINTLGVPLLKKYEAKYPGIDTDPGQYGSLSDALTAKFGKGIYSFGGMTENDPLLQEASAIQAWGMKALMSGRINKQMMDIINAHLPQAGFSPGANYDRLSRLLTTILPAQLEGIGAGRKFNPNDPLANMLGMGNDVWSSPPTAAEQGQP